MCFCMFSVFLANVVRILSEAFLFQIGRNFSHMFCTCCWDVICVFPKFSKILCRKRSLNMSEGCLQFFKYMVVFAHIVRMLSDCCLIVV